MANSISNACALWFTVLCFACSQAKVARAYRWISSYRVYRGKTVSLAYTACAWRYYPLSRATGGHTVILYLINTLAMNKDPLLPLASDAVVMVKDRYVCGGQSARDDK